MSLCFALQQVLVPVHLTLHDHCSPDCAPVAHAHVHEGCANDHEHSHDDGDHEHHPREDHLQDALAGVLVPTLVQGPIATDAVDAVVGLDLLPLVGSVLEVSLTPRPPPHVRGSPPRAPPIRA